MPLVTEISATAERPKYSRARPLGRCWKRADGTYGAEMLVKHDSGNFVCIQEVGMVEAPPPLPQRERINDLATQHMLVSPFQFELGECICHGDRKQSNLRCAENYIRALQAHMKQDSFQVTRDLDVLGRRIGFQVQKSSRAGGAKACCVLFQNWNADNEETVTTKWVVQDGQHAPLVYIRRQTGQAPFRLEEGTKCVDCGGFVFVDTVSV